MEETASALLDPDKPVHGHEPFTGALRESMLSGRVAHGWILAGPRGVGKAMMACMAAAWLMREGKGAASKAADEPLLDHEDPGSKLVIQGAHPDFQIVRPDESDNKSGQIKIEQIRKLKGFMAHMPARGGWRVAVIDSMDVVNRNAQNALLKLLEEPPDRAMIFLVSSRPGSLLPTIRSRCRMMKLGGLPDELSRELLAAELDEVEGQRLDDLVRLGEGAPGRAIALACSQSDEFYREICTIMARARLDESQLLAICGKWAKGGAAGQEGRRGASWLVSRLLHLSAIASGLGNAQGSIPEASRRLAPAACDYENAAVRHLVASHGAERLAEMHADFVSMAQRMDGLHMDFAHFLHRELVGMHRKSLP